MPSLKLNKMMDYDREGDVVIVESISRFGRSLIDLLALINQLNDKGVQFKSLKEGNIDTTTPIGKLIFSIFSSLTEFGVSPLLPLIEGLLNTGRNKIRGCNKT